MPNKIWNLCVTSHKTPPQYLGALDNVASTIFNPDHAGAYIQSVTPPELRYEIKVDETYLRDHNEYLPNFAQYGPNERYLINKVMFSPSDVLCIVGGVGIGKTRFLLMYESEVLTQLFHDDVPPCSWIKYDFLNDGIRFSALLSSEAIRSQFLIAFCDLLESKIAESRYFGVDKEVTVVWADLLAQRGPQRQTSAVNFILRELREQEAGFEEIRAGEYEVVVRKRKAIRKALLKDADRRFSYLAILASYIKRHYFKESGHQMNVVIDNVDQEPSLVQHEIGYVINQFATLSRVRTIIAARRSTFHQHIGDAYSRTLDVVAHCGPEPRRILDARLQAFDEDPSACAQFYNPDSLPILRRGIQELAEQYLSHDLCKSLFGSLCGRSIRKTIVLAQNLICNSVYDPYQIGLMAQARELEPLGKPREAIPIGDVLRAILIGAETKYTCTPRAIIENLFEVQSQPGVAPLIKIRILQMVANRGEAGCRLTDVNNNLRWFGYSPSVICDALSELNEQPRKLIWSSTVQNRFHGEEDLIRLGHTNLSLSTEGEGYHDYLYHSLDYIQEVMLDTTVADDFGSGWEYSKFEDRFSLVFSFLSYLANQEKREVSRYLTNSSVSEYVRAFGRSPVIVLEMLRSVRAANERILDSVLANRKRGDQQQLKEYATTLLINYDSRITEMENLQARFMSADYE